jgi:hypothetical protein
VQFKILEIRDEGTHIPVMAMRMLAENDVQDYYVHGRCGHPRDGHSIVVMHLDNMRATNDPYQWPDLGMGRRTMGSAHDYIINHFDELKDGDVVDVRVILGEAKESVPSDRYWNFATGKHEFP